MTKEELEKATGQELIEQRDYCGVDGYYGDYLDDVNAEMLKRFNHLAELEKENAELKGEADSVLDNWCRGNDPCPHLKKRDDQLTKAKEILRSLYFIVQSRIDYKNNIGIADEMWRAEQFLKDSEAEK